MVQRQMMCQMQKPNQKLFLLVCTACAFMAGVLFGPQLQSFIPSPPNIRAAWCPPDGPNRSLIRQDGDGIDRNQSQTLPNSTADTTASNADQGRNYSSIHGSYEPAPGVIVQQKDLEYSGNLLREVPPKEGGRFLIFECVSTCGGWGDRQEGLVTVFLLAYLTNRRFGIRMDIPCQMTKFVVPNKYNWIVPEPEIQGKSTQRIRAIDHSSFAGEMPAMDFNASYREDVVFLQTNRDLFKEITTNPHYREVLPSWAKQARPEFFRDVWHTLMKPSPDLEQRLAEFLQSVHYFNRSRPLLGVHLRTGPSKHFSDIDFGNRLEHLDVLWKFVKGYVDNGSDVFVASDNPSVRSISAANFGPRHHDTAAVLRHIDHQLSDPNICQAFGDAILDQVILTHCDVFILSPGSGFSSRAAMIRGLNEQLFYFDREISSADMYKMCDPIC